ncbi:MAG TPA: phosphatase, partial [Pasteurellaceae bacterium]|nr:phosphatase [Pasteurellaceae bacterium]
IDIPTGILVGSLILCGMPIQGKIVIPNVKRTTSHRKWAIIYGLLALLTVLLSFTLGGTWLWLLWLSVSFILLSLSYLFFGTQLFRKRATGSLAASAGWLFFPYLLIARLNTHYWIDLKREKRAVEILPEISIGSILAAKDYSAVFDLTAEITYSPRENQHYFNFPLLDMVLPTTEQLASASWQLEQIVRTKQPVLICCALGYGRSVAVLLTWLICYRQYSFTQALDLIRAVRPNAVINEEIEQNILRLSRYYQKLD